LPTSFQHLVKAVGFVLVGGVDGLHLVLQGVHHAACEACADFAGYAPGAGVKKVTALNLR